MNPLARYKAALAVAFLALPTAALAVRTPAGVNLPDGTAGIGENRYRLTKSYEDALKFFKTVYPPGKFPWRPIVNQPGIKAVHIENPAAKSGSWDGMNVYETQGETRVFVLTPSIKEPRKRKR